jgi:hypothetical protein
VGGVADPKCHSSYHYGFGMATFFHKVFVPILSFSLLTACSSNRPIGTPFPEGYTLVSERIDVRTKEGDSFTTRRIEVRDDSLFTEREAFDLMEIESITEKRFSPGKSSLLVGGIGLAAAGTVMAYFLLQAYARTVVYLTP